MHPFEYSRTYKAKMAFVMFSLLCMLEKHVPSYVTLQLNEIWM